MILSAVLRRLPDDVGDDIGHLRLHDRSRFLHQLAQFLRRRGRRPVRQNVVVVDKVDVRVLVADPPRRGAGQQRRPQVGGRTQPLDDAAREGAPLLSLGGYVALALSTSELYSSTSGL